LFNPLIAAFSMAPIPVVFSAARKMSCPISFSFSC
jgi:hypothetical protein